MRTKVFKYNLQILGGAIDLGLKGQIVHAAMHPEDNRYIQIWAEHTDGATGWNRKLDVYPTGAPLPVGATHVRTVIDTAGGYVWHIYDVE